MNRTYCGSVNIKSIDKRITVNGWVNTRRDHGGVIFIDLRDHTGVLQVVFNPDSEETFKNAQNLRSEYVLELTGIIKKRLEGTINKDMSTGEVELIVDELIIQNISKTPPFTRVLDAVNGLDEGQGKWRALSHIRSDGRTVRLDLHDSTKVNEILTATLPLVESFPIRYIVGRGVPASRQPKLRQLVLEVIDGQFPKTRQSRFTSAIEVGPELSEELRNQRKKVNRLLAIFLPIATFLGWLEMR